MNINHQPENDYRQDFYYDEYSAMVRGCYEKLFEALLKSNDGETPTPPVPLS